MGRKENVEMAILSWKGDENIKAKAINSFSNKKAVEQVLVEINGATHLRELNNPTKLKRNNEDLRNLLITYEKILE